MENENTLPEKIKQGSLEEIINIFEKGEGTHRRFVYAGIILDNEGKLKPFIPRITFSVFHGDEELIPKTTTFGFVDLPVNELPEEKNAPFGTKTDEEGKYMFYTSEEGKEVKFYYTDNIYPDPGTYQAYIIKDGFLPDERKSGKFSGTQGLGQKRSNNTESIEQALSAKQELQKIFNS